MITISGRGGVFPISVIVTCGMLLTTAANSQTGNWEWCLGKNNPTTAQRIDACTAIIDSSTDVPSNRARALGNRGVAYANSGNNEHAIRDYDEALRLDATSGFSHRIRGNKYRLERNIDGAIAEYTAAIQRDSADTFAFSNRGSLYLNEKDYDRAIADFSEAIRLDPTWSIAYLGRAAAYRARGDISLAFADYDEAIRLNPKSATAFSNRGLAHYANKNAAQAISDYSQAIQLDPKAWAAFHNRGIAYHFMKDYDRAIADLTEAIKINPKLSGTFLLRASAHQEKRDFLQAISDYDQALQIDPQLHAAYGDRCGARIAAGQDLQLALADCNESLRLQKNQLRALNNRGFTHLKLGSIAHAISDFDAALATDAKYAWSLHGRGLAKWKKGDTSGAEADAKAAEKIRGDIAAAVEKYYGLPVESGLSLRTALARIADNPMVFVVARGRPDACGPGCSEWIMADGSLDKESGKRFRKFLGTLKGRKLPVFFNSGGGHPNEARAIGVILRERKITAGVSVTVPEDCVSTNARHTSCRRMMQSKPDSLAKLRPDGAVCNSACVYALMGASVRKIPDEATVGVHTPFQPSQLKSIAPRGAKIMSDEQYRVLRRQYAQKMGVDPELIALADSHPHISLRILTRDEIARLRLESPRP